MTIQIFWMFLQLFLRPRATMWRFPKPRIDEGTTRCGAIAVLDPFNACLARNEPFSHCLTTHVRPAGLRRCSASSPCRDDYLCAGEEGGGVCVPPYFLFQMRVDGHP